MNKQLSSTPVNFKFPLFRLLALLSYFILLLAGVLVPSDGAHGLLNPKTLAFILASMAIPLYFFSNTRTLLSSLNLFFFLILFLFFCSLFMAVGLLYETSGIALQIDQLKLYVITFFFIFYTLTLYQDNALTFSSFLKVFTYGNLFYISSKLGFIILKVFNVVSISALAKMTGIRIMEMSVSADFSRLQTSMDISTPFLIFFVLESQNFGVHFSKKFRWGFAFLGMISVVISFSRVLIFIAFLGFLFYFMHHSLRRMLKGAVLFLSLMTAVIPIVGFETVEKMVQMRLFSSKNSESDEIRSHQIHHLTEELSSKPLLGLGIGGYAQEAIRDRDNRHSYEVQWVALLAQLGFIGILFLILPICFIFMLYLQRPLRSIHLYTATLFGAWLMAGFTNPFVISLTSGMIYALFILAALELRTRSGTTHSLPLPSPLPLPKV